MQAPTEGTPHHADNPTPSHLGVSRRDLLRTTGTAAIAVSFGAMASPAWAAETASFAVDPFRLGVASGDATSRSVILWTRLAPAPHALDAGTAQLPDVVDVHWSVSRVTPGTVHKPRYSGTVECRRDEGFSVHLDVETAVGGGRLVPGGEYSYEFAVPGPDGTTWRSTGRTRTAPDEDADTEARFVVMGCQSFGQNQQFFPIGQNHLRQRTAGELDAGPLPHFGVFVGDYMYEFGGKWATGQDAVALQRPCETLDEYRLRYAWYKARPDLQDFHRNYPMYGVPDDHEWWNDIYGGTIARSRFERFNAATQAYWENMPMRARPVDTLVDGRPNTRTKGSLELHRSVRWGKNLNLVLVDVRQHRRIDDTTMLGEAQLGQVVQWLREDTATWSAVASGGPIAVFGERNIEWCQFDSDREAVTAVLAERPNRVSLGGDLHCGMVNAVRRHDDDVSDFIATEFVTAPASSGGDVKWGELIHTGEPTDGAGTTIERATFIEGGQPQRGYLQCTVGRRDWVSEFFVGNDTTRRDGPVASAGRFRIASGTVGAHRVDD
ncbi:MULTISPECIES: alkaline phosphatase D family protein [unclassified Knoellia]|uniref:alkaline phosphatase D family protein n=1 Tax=Knoellia altitudinis TaxID=3404795 RepID=UPI003618D67C